MAFFSAVTQLLGKSPLFQLPQEAPKLISDVLLADGALGRCYQICNREDLYWEEKLFEMLDEGVLTLVFRAFMHKQLIHHSEKQSFWGGISMISLGLYALHTSDEEGIPHANMLHTAGKCYLLSGIYLVYADYIQTFAS